MTAPATPHALGAPARFLLAAVLALGVAFGFATTASATTGPAAQNAVGASTTASAPLVGLSANVSPATHLESYDSQAKTASATGVAADSATVTYSERVIARAAEESGPMHNFPTTYDETIIGQGTRTVAPSGYTQYSLPGTINGTAGVYQIGGWSNAAGDAFDITHRFFMPGG